MHGENRFHHIVRRGTRSDLSIDGDSVQLNAENASHWVIKTSRERIVHTRFDAFITQLGELASDSRHPALLIKAHGHFDDVERVFNASQVTITFK